MARLSILYFFKYLKRAIEVEGEYRPANKHSSRRDPKYQSSSECPEPGVGQWDALDQERIPGR